MELAPGSREAVLHKRGSGIGMRSAISVLLFLIVIVSVFSVTLVTYFQARQLARNEIRSRLLAAAGTVALALDAEKHSRIALDRKKSTPEFWDLQVKLRKLQKSIPDARYVYTLRMNKKNQMVFVGDSDESQFKSELGEIYRNETPVMRAAFASPSRALAEAEFSSDRWGTWLSGYAPIVRKNGSVEAIVGIDIAAHEVLELERRYLGVGVTSAGLISVLLLPILILATHTITKPLRRVTLALKRIQDFDLNSEISIKSRLREVRDLTNALEATRAGLKSFKKYIPSDLATELVSTRVEAKTGAKKREISLLFTDFEGFTSFSESVPPDALVQLLNKYFEAMSRAIEEHQGTIDKFIGDSVMAFWNAPSDVPNHPEQACLAAVKIVERIKAINAQRNREGLVGLNVRVGVHTGIAMVGNIGHEGRLNYTALGDAVNMASRIESLNKKYGTNILISAATAERLGSHFRLKSLEDVILKGKSRTVSILELQGVDLDVDE